MKRGARQYWKVTINGRTFRRGLTRKEADEIAERWQGSHSEHRGLLKHINDGVHVEVFRDYEMERDFDERLEEARLGNPQRLVVWNEITS